MNRRGNGGRAGAGTPKTGRKQCKCCNHPGIQEIDLLLINAAPYAAIISKMRAAYPEAPELNEANLSRHYRNHVLTRPVKTTEVDPETGEIKEGFIVGHLASAPLVPKEAIPAPEDRITLPDALATIINIGLRNAIHNPETVSMKDVLAAIEIARKLGLRGDDQDEFDEAWRALAGSKERVKRQRRRRKVTIEETTTIEDDGQDEGQVIDGQVVITPDDWSDEDLKLLEGGQSGEDTEDTENNSGARE